MNLDDQGDKKPRENGLIYQAFFLSDQDLEHESKLKPEPERLQITLIFESVKQTR